MVRRRVVSRNSRRWRAAVLCALALVACESAPGVREPPSSLRSPPSSEITIYLPRLFEDGSLGLRGVARTVELSEERGRDALEALIRGPNGDERAADLQYALNRRTRVRSFRTEGGTAAVELDEGLNRVHGRPFSELVYWAIVYTLTETPGIERVMLVRGDVPVTELGDPPVRVPAPAGRVDVPSWARPR